MTDRLFKTLFACLLGAIAYAMLPSMVLGQSNKCADCHFANETNDRAHLLDWQRSAHAPNVGCEVCHGGDPTTYATLQAHSGVTTSTNPASPASRVNLPETCGSCHRGPIGAFKDSRHWQLIQEGNREAPTCSTCHSAGGGFLLSSRGLERRCKRCHGPGKEHARPDFPVLAATSHDEIETVRELLATAERLARRSRSKNQQREWLLEIEKAEAPLKQAIASTHRFTFEDFDQRAALALATAEALLIEIANQGHAKEP